MSEGEPRGIHQTARWAVGRIAQRMEQTPVELHPGKGVDGYGFKVIDPENPTDARTVGLFPDQGIVTITTPDVRIKIRNATVTPAADGLWVSTGGGASRTLFLRDGHVALEVFPAPSRTPQNAPLSGENPPAEGFPDLSPISDSGSSGDVETASLRAAETSQTAEQKERQSRVKITGRLGADPHYEELARSGSIVRFPVAEQTTEEQATWHRVYSTGKSAEKIRNIGLAKGDKVNVDGYRQERAQKKRDGTSFKQEVVFAVHVKKLGASATSQAETRAEDDPE